MIKKKYKKIENNMDFDRKENPNFDIDGDGNISYKDGSPASLSTVLIEEPYDRENFFNNYSKEGTVFSIPFEGPFIRVWKDKEDKLHFSTRKQIDADNSFWGNKEKKFKDLFLDNGGKEFLELIDFPTGIINCFSVMDQEFITRSRIDMRNNETVIGYIYSTDLQGNIIENTDFDSRVFYRHIPENMSDLLPTKEELSGKILLPINMDAETSMYILENGYSLTPRQPLLGHNDQICKFEGECVIARNGNTVIKIYPEVEYNIRDLVAGNKNNRLNILFLNMDHVNDEDKYNKYLEIGIFDISILSDCDPRNVSEVLYNFFMNKKQSGINDYQRDNINHRRLNILANFLLFCPLPQVTNFINYWREYQNCRSIISKFLKDHNGSVVNGKYHERLDQYHQRAHSRMKDLALRAKNYASNKKVKGPYHVKVLEKLDSLLENEYGSSLYRIRKAVLSLRE